jgi:hypothetical protein
MARDRKYIQHSAGKTPGFSYDSERKGKEKRLTLKED